MALSAAQQQALQQWLQQRFPTGLDCLRCDAPASQLSAGDLVIAPRYVEEAGRRGMDVTVGEGYVPIRCTACGFVQLFSADIIGLVAGA